MSELILIPGSATIKELDRIIEDDQLTITLDRKCKPAVERAAAVVTAVVNADDAVYGVNTCLLYTSPSPRDRG